MLDKRLEKVALSLIGAFLFYLAFSKLNFWFSLPVYLLLLAGIRSFRFWFATGFLSFLFTLVWIRIAMVDYGGIFPPVAYLLITLLVIFLTLYQFGLTYLVWKLMKFNPLLLPFLWTSVELVRSNFPYGGFPWLLTGEVLVDFPILKHYLSAGGVYLGSLVLWFLSLSPLLLRERKGPVLLAVILLLPLLFDHPERKGPQNLRVAVVQPNVEESIKLNKERFYDYLPTYWRLLDELLKEDPDIVFLPESAFPFTGSELPERGKKLLDYSRKATIVTGMIDVRFSGVWEPYNSVFVIKDGKVVDFYDKVRLLPFGEYVPFPFGFVKEVFGAIAGIDYVPGRGPRCLKVEKYKVGTPICFEVSYFGLVRKLAECSDFIAVLTNDGWFRDSDGTFQHLRQARVRALETGKFVLWVNNTGPSAVISPEGKRLNDIPYGKAGYLIFDFQE